MLAVCLFWTGLVAGAAVGARFFVPEGSGLAGPAIALGYGLGGAVAGLLLALLAAWRLPARRLPLAAAAGAGVAVLATALVLLRAASVAAERRAAAQPGTPLPPPGSFVLSLEISEQDPKRPFRDLEIDAADWSFRYTAAGPEAALCRGRLDGREAEAVREHLGLLEERVVREPELCAPEDASSTFRWTKGAESRTLSAGSACFGQVVELASLRRILGRLALEPVSQGRVRCEAP